MGGMLLIPVIVAGSEGTAAQSNMAAVSAGKPVPAEDSRVFTEYLKQRAAAGAFSGAVLAVRHGKPVLQQGYGMADRQRGIANTAQTKFDIASMGKMFTGVAVAQLVEHGKLSFDDKLGSYVSGFPPEVAGTVTIHQLLTHTAGMGDAALIGGPSLHIPQVEGGAGETLG